MAEVQVNRVPSGAPPEAETVYLVVTGDALILELDDGETLEFALQGFEEALDEAKSDMSDAEAA